MEKSVICAFIIAFKEVILCLSVANADLKNLMRQNKVKTAKNAKICQTVKKINSFPHTRYEIWDPSSGAKKTEFIRN